MKGRWRMQNRRATTPYTSSTPLSSTFDSRTACLGLCLPQTAAFVPRHDSQDRTRITTRGLKKFSFVFRSGNGARNGDTGFVYRYELVDVKYQVTRTLVHKRTADLCAFTHVRFKVYDREWIWYRKKVSIASISFCCFVFFSLTKILVICHSLKFLLWIYIKSSLVIIVIRLMDESSMYIFLWNLGKNTSKCQINISIYYILF